MKSKLKAVLKPKRYQHSLGVCSEAVKLAKLYGVDHDKAYFAGLLHDCAKGCDVDAQIKLCKKFGIELDHITLACPAVIHAPLGAEIAKREFGIKDEEILDAIKWHTVAKAGMTKLGKIIYIADMIEPMRDYDGVDELRKKAYENLDEAMIEALRQSIEYNLEKNVLVHPNTLEAWNDILMAK